jgi:hypothetical protein
MTNTYISESTSSQDLDSLFISNLRVISLSEDSTLWKNNSQSVQCILGDVHLIYQPEESSSPD